MDTLGKIPEIYDYIRPVLDIGVLAFILYKMYGIIVKTQSLQIIKFGFTILIAFAVDIEFICAGSFNRICHRISAGVA